MPTIEYHEVVLDLNISHLSLTDEAIVLHYLRTDLKILTPYRPKQLVGTFKGLNGLRDQASG
jgi:hypothetical protein